MENCKNCRYTTFNKDNQICMHKESKNYGKLVTDKHKCDLYKADYTLEESTKKFLDENYYI